MIADAGVSVRLVTLSEWQHLLCTKTGAVLAAGVTAFDGVDAGPSPTLLVAVTVNVYGVPLVSPLIVV